MTQDFKARFAQKLTDEEKKLFAEKVFEARRNNPKMSWPIAFDAGRAMFPGRETLPLQIEHPSSYPWLMRELETLCEQTGHDVLGRSNALTSDQKKLFAKCCHEIRIAQPQLSWPKTFALVNQQMPDDARIGKSFMYPRQIKWLNKLLDELAANDSSKANNPVPDKIANPDEIIAEEPLPPVQEKPEPPTIVETPSAGMQSLETALIQAIVSTVKPIVLNIINSPQFANTLIAAFREYAPAPMGSSHPIIAETLKPSSAKMNKPRVLIVGLLGQQAQEIQKEWSQVYDLRIYDSDVTSDKIRSILPHCDKAILMTKFASHRAQDAMRGCNGFTYCNGGVSALKELLNEH